MPGTGSSMVHCKGLSAIFERMTPREVHALIVQAAAARLKTVTGYARRVSRVVAEPYPEDKKEPQRP